MEQRPPQMIVTSRIKENKSGGESLVFDINLALFTLTCIAVVPSDDTDEAPVYVHFKTRRHSNGKPNGKPNGHGKRSRTRQDSDVPEGVGNR